MSSISGIGGVSSINVQSMDLETALMAVQSNRANLLETQLKDQISSVQAKNDQISKLNQLLGTLNKAAALFNGKAAHAKPAKPVEKKAAVAAKPAAAAPAQALPEMAAIAAAVAVVMDGAPHHIISIEPSSSGAWVQSGRLAHHGSHLGAH